LRQLTKDGRKRIIETSWTLVRDAGGERERVLSINNDVTEERSVQAQLLRAQRLESIGTLAGGIAHDLNNVLTPILMAIEVFRGEETSAARLELLRMVEENVERGAAMVRQVLSFARGVEGDTVPVDLHRVASDVGRIVRETFPKSIAFDLVVQKDLRKVQADPTHIHQVLMNLCVNARDAMPSGGKLSLALANADLDETYAAMNPEARSGSYVSITVADSGVGVAPEHLDRLFEPFFTTKDVGSGTGLGLSTVHTIVRGHGGFVSVYSELGNGATFRVYLPSSSEQVAERSGAPQPELPRGEGELILLVDDEESIREVARRTLEQFGYRVLLAANGAEAISLFARRNAEIALVMTDMAMPVMDGYATIVALQAIDSQVRIVASSGLGNERPIARAEGCGVRHFVPKPYSAESLLKTLESALREDE
ncbi:MAG TPA: ATP-binding protein, partial [Thermoanaerobaculia bacterium]|nr:ATP-binding protein [Thermoanaerobaculia bacterium]